MERPLGTCFCPISDGWSVRFRGIARRALVPISLCIALQLIRDVRVEAPTTITYSESKASLGTICSMSLTPFFATNTTQLNHTHSGGEAAFRS